MSVATQESLSIGTLKGRGRGCLQTHNREPHLFYHGRGKLTRSMRDKLPYEAFGLPKQRKYPIDTPERARAAIARAAQGLKRGWINKEQHNSIVRLAERRLAKWNQSGEGKKIDYLVGLAKKYALPVATVAVAGKALRYGQQKVIEDIFGKPKKKFGES